MDVSIREVRSDELRSLLYLYEHLHASDVPLPDDAVLEQVWADILSDPRMHCFVAELDGVLVGSCILAILPNLTRGARPYGLIENVVTHSGHRRKGFGTRLLRHALQFAWQRNCYKVMLLTGREDAHQFYEQAGFKRGIKTGFVATPERNLS
jgi:GNAT superfamily N-acetyltransferase